jgi:hypothetical protein
MFLYAYSCTSMGVGNKELCNFGRKDVGRCFSALGARDLVNVFIDLEIVDHVSATASEDCERDPH